MKNISLYIFVLTLAATTTHIHASAQFQSTLKFARHSPADEFQRNLKPSFKNGETHLSHNLPNSVVGRALAKDIRRSHEEKLDLAALSWEIFYSRFLINLPADWELSFVSSYSESEMREVYFSDFSEGEDSFDDEEENRRLKESDEEGKRLFARMDELIQKIKRDLGADFSDRKPEGADEPHVVKDTQVQQIPSEIEAQNPIGLRRYCLNFVRNNPGKCFILATTIAAVGILIYWHMPSDRNVAIHERIFAGVTSTPARVTGVVSTGAVATSSTAQKAISNGIGAQIGFAKDQWFNLWNTGANSSVSFRLNSMACSRLKHWYKHTAMMGKVSVEFVGGCVRFISWNNKHIDFPVTSFHNGFSTTSNWIQNH
jgi:hypothetical protein